MNRIAVMQVCDTLAAGGQERVALNIANLLPGDRYRSHLCTTRADGPLADAVAPGARVLLIDDVLATGGTAAAAAALLRKVQANILEINFVIELGFLSGRNQLQDYRVCSLVTF